MDTNKKVGHTPGPWEIVSWEGAPWGRIRIALLRFIEVQGRTQEEAFANVHLVAAAPELLEACKNIAHNYRLVPIDTFYKEEPKEAIQKLITAIAKAEGRE